MSRKADRTHAFNLVFQMDFYDPSEYAGLMERYLGDLPPDADRAFVEREFKGVADNLERLDQIISGCAQDWELSRLMKTDLAIMRLAVYELLFNEDIPHKVSINEAVELCKTFSGEDSPGFVNGVLGKALLSITAAGDETGGR